MIVERSRPSLPAEIQLTIVPLSTVVLGPQGSQLVTDLGDGSTIRRGGDHLGRDDRRGGDKESDNAAEHGVQELIAMV